MRRSQVPRKGSQDCGAHTARWNPRRTRLSPTFLQQPALEARGVRAGPGAKHLHLPSREALRGSNNPGWGKSADKGGDSEDDTGPGSPRRAGGSAPWLRAVLSSSSKAAGRPGVGTPVPTSQQRGAAGERRFPGSPGDRTGPESPLPLRLSVRGLSPNLPAGGWRPGPRAPTPTSAHPGGSRRGGRHSSSKLRRKNRASACPGAWGLHGRRRGHAPATGLCWRPGGGARGQCECRGLRVRVRAYPVGVQCSHR